MDGPHMLDVNIPRRASWQVVAVSRRHGRDKKAVWMWFASYDFSAWRRQGLLCRPF